VGKSVLQLEAGVDLGRRDINNGTFRVTTTPFKLRFGVLENLELHFLSQGYTVESSEIEFVDDTRDYGFSDPGLGAKFMILKQDRATPRTALLATLTFPVGAEEIDGGDDVVPFGAVLRRR